MEYHQISPFVETWAPIRLMFLPLNQKEAKGREVGEETKKAKWETRKRYGTISPSSHALVY